MPYRSEHSCRLISPDDFVRFRRMNNFQGSGYDVIMGFRKNGGSAIQAIRYPTGRWTRVKAQKHCEEKGGSFHAANQGAQRLENLAIAYAAAFEPIIGDDGRTFVKIKVMDTSRSKNRWRVTEDAMRKGANTILQAKLLGPPPPGKKGDIVEDICRPHIGRWTQYGKFISYEQNGATVALGEVTHPYAAEKIRSKEWVAVSPKIWVNAQRNENGEILVTDYSFDHILFVDTPAFDDLRVTQICDSSLECGYPSTLGGALEQAFNHFDESFTVTDPQGSLIDAEMMAGPSLPAKQGTQGQEQENRKESDPLSQPSQDEGSQKCIEKLQETVKTLGAKVETLERTNTDLLKANDEVRKASEEIKAVNKQLMDDKTAREQAEHLALVNTVVDLRIKAGLVKEEERTKTVEIYAKMPNDALNLMKPDLEKQVNALAAAAAETAKAKAKFQAGKADSGLTVGFWNPIEKKWEA